MARIWNKHKQINPHTKDFGVGAGTPLKRKVFVALSGGVDSAVAAAVLKKRGFRVVAFFMKNWSGTFGLKESECPWVADRRDAMAVAAKLDIPFHTLDFEKEYKREVLDYFFREYQAGRTPNPDVLCNNKIKFGAFLEKALSLGADYIATGHYARLETTPSEPPLPLLGKEGIHLQRRGLKASPPRRGGGRGWCEGKETHQLLQAKDKNKDQTYFLHRLTQAQLSKAIFPIGDYTKPQVRAMAKKFGLPNWDKKGSSGLCFVGHIQLKQFLSQKIKEKPGEIVWIPPASRERRGGARNDKGADGKVVGEHKGLFWYTIGQRQGIGIGGIGPFYAVEKDLANNRLIVTHDKNDKRLFYKEVYFTDPNWIAGDEPRFPLRCQGRIRYREALVECRIVKVRDSISRRGDLQNDSVIYRAAFAKPVWAPAAGQSIVFYKGEACLGGGVII